MPLLSSFEPERKATLSFDLAMDRPGTYVVFLSFMIVASSVGVESCDGLSYDFYQSTCPEVEQTVRATLAPFFLSDPSSAAALLRLLFHDCQVQGCDASLLTDPGETESIKNFGIRKREVIGSIKSIIEARCPGQVSCSDILVLAAREAVFVSGGPMIPVPLGRRDAASAPNLKLVEASLPPANAGVDEMLRIFGDKGMSLEESVAIIGAHTLGVTHCRSIMTRLRNPDPSTPISQALFEAFLRETCPLENANLFLTPNSSFIVNDPTAAVFDNLYFASGIKGDGVLPVDAEVALHPRTRSMAAVFATDEQRFFRDFSKAFVKLSCSGIAIGNSGVIRTKCDEPINH